MFLLPRHKEILEIARMQGKVLVEDLASRFEMTPQTIRKDLNELCEKKLLNRIHGGAVFPSGTGMKSSAVPSCGNVGATTTSGSSSYQRCQPVRVDQKPASALASPQSNVTWLMCMPMSRDVVI